jgi:hypothetical protein
LNETWCNLLHELQFYEETEDHTMLLRTRWAMGAADWMSGGNDSKENDKELFNYSDEEWSYIWTTMLEDGAWTVPSIKDTFGNNIKENHAPEIFIKYIAHDLKCHILIFDLMLGQVQFCSGNHVRDKNVLFESPLLLYSTGSHFQAVFQRDHENFINYAKELEERNNVMSLPPSKETMVLGEKDSFEKIIPEDSHSEKLAGLFPIPDVQPVFKKKKRSQELSQNASMKPETSSGENKQIKIKPIKKRKHTIQIEEPTIEISNKYQCLNPEENDGEETQATGNSNQENLKTPANLLPTKEEEGAKVKKKASGESRTQEEKDRTSWGRAVPSSG